LRTTAAENEKLNSEELKYSWDKNGNVFPEPTFLKALTYFKEAEPESYKDIDVEWNSIKRFFVKAVTDYVIPISNRILLNVTLSLQ
jgi:hypothetical protein